MPKGKIKDPLTFLIDGDMIVFQACASAETEINWGEGFWTLHAEENEAKIKVDEKIQSLVEKVLKKVKHRGEYKIILCFTDDENFRKKLYPLYKANRIGKRKPVCYQGVKAWAKEAYNAYQRPTLEADDCIGILATKPNSNTVIISSDKDFKSIPGKFYDYGKDVLHEVTELEADRWHMYQTLIGDTADNYPGCPGIGEVSAKKALEGLQTLPEMWKAVVDLFEKKKLILEDAVLMARVSRILMWSDFDMKTREVRLWEPPHLLPLQS